MSNDYSEESYSDVMRADMREKNGQLLIEIELPGYSKENISAELEGGVLTIHARRNEELESDMTSTHYLLRERFTGDMKRSFRVGDSVHQKDVTAQLKDGILSIIIVKNENSVEGEKRKLIDIQNVIQL
jgi:HSP20 family molecular chaperone IbpA